MKDAVKNKIASLEKIDQIVIISFIFLSISLLIAFVFSNTNADSLNDMTCLYLIEGVFNAKKIVLT